MDSQNFLDKLLKSFKIDIDFAIFSQAQIKGENDTQTDTSQTEITKTAEQTQDSTESSTQYKVPTKEIYEPQDLKKWEESEVYYWDTDKTITTVLIHIAHTFLWEDFESLNNGNTNEGWLMKYMY